MIGRGLAGVLALALAASPAAAAPAAGSAAGTAATAGDTDADTANDPVAVYFSALQAMKLLDASSGNIDSLRHELAVSEGLLRDGAFLPAAVSLYAIVKSPRYRSFHDFVEYQNAEYDLAVALARAGSYGAALDEIEAILKRGPAAPYWGPAHRRAVDIALETRDHAGVLARLEAIKLADPIPVSAAGERAYLRGRAAYDQHKLADAEGELVTISKQSRLYSSAVYFRGVIRARRGEYKAAAEAMCEISATPDDDHFSFVVDERYFTIKDLARLGLGRIAHEMGEYDDAYYHYFQIPDDSQYLPDALFEAAWSMYQKRELPTARDLVGELLNNFPTSPEWPEASLLAGYIELADCKFDDSQKSYDQLIARLEPIVGELDRARKDPELRRELFATALTRYREVKQDGTDASGGKPGSRPATTPRDEVLALLRLDPQFVRLSDAVSGARALSDSASQVSQGWRSLAKRIKATKVGAISDDGGDSGKADAEGLARDFIRLGEQTAEQADAITRARREGTLPAADADAELARLKDLAAKIAKARAQATAASDATGIEMSDDQAAPSLRVLINNDQRDARRLTGAARAMADKLAKAGDELAQIAIEKTYTDARKVLDKAKLGKVDAVIGEKRKLDIEVQDLAAGRFPEELIGRMWDQSQIGDDEEYWPWEGEYWADEYEGFR